MSPFPRDDTLVNVMASASSSRGFGFKRNAVFHASARSESSLDSRVGDLAEVGGGEGRGREGQCRRESARVQNKRDARESRRSSFRARCFRSGGAAAAAAAGKDVPLCQFEVIFSLVRRKQADFVNPANLKRARARIGYSHRIRAANRNGAPSRGEV